MHRNGFQIPLSLRRTTGATGRVAPCLLALGVCCTAPVRADTLPPLKSGLWETKTTSNGVTRTTKACKQDRVERETNGSAHRHCRETVTRTPTGYDIEMQCAIGPAIFDAVTRVTGDFEATVRMESVGTPYNPRPSDPTTIETVMEMRRLGPCEAERK